jgi:branched-chain amino acid transport system substrate-binding protein
MPAPLSRRALSRRVALALPALLAAPAVLRAQGAPVKIGLISTFSGPGGYLGQDIRDAFLLAAADGTLGGVPVQMLIEDDGLKPAQARQIATRFQKTEGVRLFTGIVFSNVLGAVAPDLLDEGGIYVSPNAGPSNLAGKDCHPNYWVVSWQNDTLHESAGAHASRLGFRHVYLLAPNYQAGKDAITGFRRRFTGEVIGETYTSLDQTDFAPELAKIRAAGPDAVFQFHPGGLGITFLRQYQQAGLLGKIPMVVAAPSLDSTTLAAVGEAAIGVHVSSHWNSDFDNPANKAFVAAFQAKYNRLPTYYASQGYDTALAIGAALKGCKGEVADAAAFRTAMRPAAFQSVRGAFRFGSNQHPVQDWYALEVARGEKGLVLRTQERILHDYGDAYAAQCRM